MTSIWNPSATVPASDYSIVNPKLYPFLCKGDGTTDDYVNFQAAIEYAKSIGAIFFIPEGRFKCTTPPLFYSDMVILGVGADRSIIVKSGTTTRTETSLAPGGLVTDSYAVNSVVSVYHAPNDYAYRFTMQNVGLEGSNSTYGIYAPRLSQSSFRDMYISGVSTTIQMYQEWLVVIERVTGQAPSSFVLVSDDGSHVGGSTSLTIINSWPNFDNSVRQPSVGFSLYGVKYFTLIDCGVDNLIRTDTTKPYCYEFIASRSGHLIGCGAENYAAGVIYADASSLEITAFNSSGGLINAGWTGTIGGIYNNASVLDFNTCEFGAYPATAVINNMVIQNGAVQTEKNCVMPSGGSAFISYSGSSVRKVSQGAIEQFLSGGAAGLSNYANDAAAAVGGIAIGQYYRNGSVVQMRVA